MTQNSATLRRVVDALASTERLPSEQRHRDTLRNVLLSAIEELETSTNPTRVARRMLAMKSCIDALEGLVLHRLDAWLLSTEGKNCSVLDEQRKHVQSNKNLHLYMRRVASKQSKGNPSDVPSLSDLKYWIDPRQGLQPEELRMKVLRALGIPDDPEVRARLQQISKLRDLIAHVSNYQKTHFPEKIPAELDDLVEQLPSLEVVLRPRAFEVFQYVALALLASTGSVETLQAALRASLEPKAPTKAPDAQQQLAIPPAPRAVPKKPRAFVVVVVVVVVLVCCVVAVLLYAEPWQEAPNETIVVPPLTLATPSNPAFPGFQEFLARWSMEAWNRNATEETVRSLYHDRTTIMWQSGPASLTPREVLNSWNSSPGRITFDPRNFELSVEPFAAQSPNVRSSCPPVPLLRVALRATMTAYRCRRNGPALRAERKEYLLRVVPLTNGEFRVCYEAWSDRTEHELCRPS